MRRLGPFVVILGVLPALLAQNGRVVLSGHMRPGVVAANDLGRVAASVTMRHVTLVLQPTASQQTDLEALLARQQDPASSEYHRWLTPEQFGARFGSSQAEIDRITGWLAAQKLTVDEVGRGRTTIAFTGAVRDVEQAFQTEIHNFTVNGERHFANASEPSVPAALAGSVQVIHGLDDFRLKPRLKQGAMRPAYTSPISGSHFLAPEDVATIFDITPLHNSGFTGSGQKIVVAGQTAINISDIEEFRTYFNLAPNDPQLVLVPNTGTPAISSNDLGEADLDLEWTGAVAPDAQIIFVYSNDVETSLKYAIDQNLAPVISLSYGLCEALSGAADLTTLNTYGQQASAQGISWVSAAGDNGANDCYGQASRTPNGLSVDAPASVPYVTAVGGTTLTEGSGNYWNPTNGANHATAISYIPESVWNDTALDGSPSAGGGGASTFFAKPVWQTGPGVPKDSARDVPDISMPASADHDAYLVYSGGALQAYGGTSVAAPVFAGITGLLNQYLVANGVQKTAGLGSLNPALYALAQASPGAFHDITVGNNKVPACTSASCASTLVGYDAGPGYDQASGLGSVDAYNLVTAWAASGTALKAEPTVLLTSSVSTLPTNGSTVLTATVTAASGATPTGLVSFYVGGNLLGVSTLAGSGATATATLSLTAGQLTSGTPEATASTDPNTGTTVDTVNPLVTAVYSGDVVYAVASATLVVPVVSPTAMVLSAITSAASYQRSFAPGMIVALFGQNLAASTPAPPAAPLPTNLAGTTVTLNGIPAPLYYVSPTQINLQIPYEIPVNSTAIVKVTANGQSATYQVLAARNSPEVFGDGNNLMVPYQTTGRGQAAYLFATGDGLFAAPAVTTGTVPTSGTLTALPGSVKVTVGGVTAPIVFVGVPSWSIGVSQINFTIPAGAPLGKQAVVVTVAGVVSAPVYVTVTP